MLSTLLLGAALLLNPQAAAAGAPGDAQVSPNPVLAGQQIEVVAACAAGVASATISAAALGGASDIPMLKSHASATEFVVTLTIPKETLPGTYDLGGACGNGEGFIGHVVVATVTGPAGGGGSASHGPNATLLSLGVGLLSLALLAGALRLRRRPAP
jgi:hypothetical protein